VEVSPRECADSEQIIRAITTAHYDEVEQRVNSGLFLGPGTSVSRLAVLSLAEIFDIFKRDLGQPPQRVFYAGEINVGVLQQMGREHNQPTVITVEKKPEPNNPAHAEIPQKIPRGLSKKIIKALKRHPAPQD
jgi:hypothetical protein